MLHFGIPIGYVHDFASLGSTHTALDNLFTVKKRTHSLICGASNAVLCSCVTEELGFYPAGTEASNVYTILFKFESQSLRVMENKSLSRSINEEV